MKPLPKKSLALLLAALFLLTVLAGCSKSAAGAYEAYDSAPAESAPESPAAADLFYDAPTSEDFAYAEEESINLTAAQYDSAEGGEVTTQPLSEKIIYSGSLHIETTAFEAAVSSVEAMINEFGGFIESSDVNGHTEYRSDGTSTLVDRSAYYVLRVPCARFQEFLQRSGSIGNVLSSNTYAENITSQFTDAEARKSSLKVQEERLLTMMEQVTDVESLIELENRLSEVRYELESIERQLINWQNRVDYSSVTLSIQEVEIYTPVVPVQRGFSEKLSAAFSDGWLSFTRFVQNFTLWLAEALPTLVLLALIAVIIVLFVRMLRRRRRRAKRAAHIPYAQPAPPEDPKE